MDIISQKVLNILPMFGRSENDFDTDQLAEIYLAYEHGLSNSQIYTFITPNLTADQMKIIRQYGENGFNKSQLWEIRMGLEDGFVENTIKLYANPKYDWRQMQQIRLGLKDGLSIEKIKKRYRFFQPEEAIRLMREAEPENGI